MKFKFIKTHQPEYPKELMLRWEVLRKPLGMPPGSELFPEENESLHLVAIEGKQVVGCVLFHQENEERGKLFQMAISPEYHGIGFSRRLMLTLEQALVKKGIREVYLLAGDEAISFYSHMGYHVEEGVVQCFGLPHCTMTKHLTINDQAEIKAG
ncbi:MAG: GNAT family N-acetyltransferase [Simkania sp.]|nr:GNAT family N-acetyltransferase [Simkania sp.]